MATPEQLLKDLGELDRRIQAHAEEDRTFRKSNASFRGQSETTQLLLEVCEKLVLLKESLQRSHFEEHTSEWPFLCRYLGTSLQGGLSERAHRERSSALQGPQPARRQQRRGLLAFCCQQPFPPEGASGWWAEASRHLQPGVLVLRAGKLAQSEVTELVPGDIVYVRLGQRVPVDGRVLVFQSGTAVDLCQVTGEVGDVRACTSEPTSETITSSRNMVFKDSFVVKGSLFCLALRSATEPMVPGCARDLEEDKFIVDLNLPAGLSMGQCKGAFKALCVQAQLACRSFKTLVQLGCVGVVVVLLTQELISSSITLCRAARQLQRVLVFVGCDCTHDSLETLAKESAFELLDCDSVRMRSPWSRSRTPTRTPTDSCPLRPFPPVSPGEGALLTNLVDQLSAKQTRGVVLEGLSQPGLVALCSKLADAGLPPLYAMSSLDFPETFKAIALGLRRSLFSSRLMATSNNLSPPKGSMVLSAAADAASEGPGSAGWRPATATATAREASPSPAATPGGHEDPHWRSEQLRSMNTISVLHSMSSQGTSAFTLSQDPASALWDLHSGSGKSIELLVSLNSIGVVSRRARANQSFPPASTKSTLYSKMARILLAFLLVVGATTAVSGEATSVSAVQKVIQMLTDMMATSKQGKKDEEVAYAKFTTWCDQEQATLKSEISQNKEDIGLLEAEIGKLDSDVATLGQAIADLHNKVAKNEAEVKAQTAQRERDHVDFIAEQKDYSESIDALERAIAVLQKQNYDRPGTQEALLQVAEKQRVPEKARALITAFIAMMGGEGSGKAAQDPMSYQAPEANTYEFQSGGIIELLKKLKDEFRSKLGDCQKEEMNSKHAYDMIVEDLTDSTENANKEIDEKTIEKQRKAEKSALDKKQLTATKTMKVENENTLEATITECREKGLSFQEKQKLRKEEIEAIGKAIEILSSPEVADTAAKYFSLAQAKHPKGTAFVQFGDSQASQTEGIRRRLREFLASEATRLHSQHLGLLAEKLAADPFAKVKKLIENMINRLTEEANQDALHEGFCDKEMGKSKLTRNKLNEEIDSLHAAVEEGKATIASLSTSTAELTKEVAELTKAMADATSMREDEKKKNDATIKDAVEAQKAVMAATAVLKEFYKKASTATALVQASPEPRRWGLKLGVKMGTEEWDVLANPNYKGSVDYGHKEGMQTFGETEMGQQDEAQYGVLALLEVIQSDFANLEADTKASEIESQRTYDKFMTESKKSKAVKERKIEMNTADQTSAEAKLQEDTADMKATHDELLAAERYHERLVPQCIDQGMTFDERTKAREAEIASLKEALSILSSEDIATSV